MQKFISFTNINQTNNAGKPVIPLQARQPVIERKISDPSSALPKSGNYPIPSFFGDRIKS